MDLRLPESVKRLRIRNPLLRYFRANANGRLIRKWSPYFEVYHRHFRRFRWRGPVVVEFGVSHGGSVQMWRHYFGPRSRIHGIDIDTQCKAFGAPGIDIHIGDQSNRDFLERLGREIGPIDVLIDDGGHHPDQQIATFEVLYPLVKPGGIYLVEDTHTSYWPKYSGGLQRPGTFVEYAKRMVDQLTAWHSRSDDFAVDDFTRSTRGVYFYDSMVVFEKELMTRPKNVRSGRRTIEQNN